MGNGMNKVSITLKVLKQWYRRIWALGYPSECANVVSEFTELALLLKYASYTTSNLAIKNSLLLKNNIRQQLIQ